MRAPLVAMLGLATTTSGFAAEKVGYAQATGYFKQSQRPTLYQPLNLLDGRDATAWCSPTADPLNELITVGFNGPITLEELRISTGNNFDTHTFAQFARAKRLAVRVDRQEQIVELEDKAGLQSITLAKPLKGSRFRIEVLDQYPSDDPESPVCVTDLVFVADGGKQLNGPWLTTRLKYDKYVAGLLGSWFAGYETTPNRFLSFNFDGTFRYSFEPFDTTREKAVVLEGRYDVSGSRLTLEAGGKKYQVRYFKDPAKKGGQTLGFDGAVPEELKGPFRSQP